MLYFLYFLLFIFSLLIINLSYSIIVRSIIRPTGKFLEIDDYKIHYIEKGVGPDLFLIHGLNGAADNFNHSLIDELAKDYHVIAIDRPGSGHSRRNKNQSADIDDQALLINRIIDFFNLKNPTLIGHSLGGAISLQCAILSPNKFKNVILLSPLTQIQDKIPMPFAEMAIRSPKLRLLASLLFSTTGAIFLGLIKLKYIFSNDKIPLDFLLKGGGLLAVDYVSFYNASRDLVALEFKLIKLIEKYSTIKIPVTIIYGQDDLILNPKLHGELLKQQIPHSELFLIPGSHMIISTQFNRIKEIIDASISKL